MNHGPALPNYNEAVDALKRQLVIAALKRTNGNKQHAANLLGIKRTTLVYILCRFGIEVRRTEK